MTDKLQSFIKDIQEVVVKHQPQGGIIIVVGVVQNEGDPLDVGCFIKGDHANLVHMVRVSAENDPELHGVLDHVAPDHVGVKVIASGVDIRPVIGNKKRRVD